MKRIWALFLLLTLLLGMLPFSGVLAQEAPSVEIISQNVWIGEKMHLMYAVYSENLPDGATVSLEIATNAAGTNAVEAVYFGKETVHGKACDIFISPTGVAPQYIQRTFYAKATIRKDSVTVASSERMAYSVLQYLYERLYISDPATVTAVQRDMYHALLDFASKADLVLNEGASRIGSYACAMVSGSVETLPYLYQAGDVIKATTNMTASGNKIVVWMVRDADTGEAIGKLTPTEMQSSGYTVTAQKNVTITAEEYEPKWTLVTDISTLKAGETIIIAAADYNVALSTAQNTNNRGQASITKNGNTVTLGDDVQQITLEDGTVDGTFAFKVDDGYLYAASSSSNNLKTQTNNNNNGSWLITIANDGTATVIAQGSNTRNIIRYNSSNSLFACYGETADSQKAICIYKLG